MCTYTYAHRHIHICTHTCARRHTDTCAHIHTHICTQTHVHTHAHRHTHICTDTCAHIHTHMCTHMCTQTHSHMHTDLHADACGCTKSSLVLREETGVRRWCLPCKERSLGITQRPQCRERDVDRLQCLKTGFQLDDHLSPPNKRFAPRGIWRGRENRRDSPTPRPGGTGSGVPAAGCLTEAAWGVELMEGCWRSKHVQGLKREGGESLTAVPRSPGSPCSLGAGAVGWPTSIPVSTPVDTGFWGPAA